jgi:sortase A
MRRALRIVGTVMIVGGIVTLLWVLVVWQWQDPFTALYTRWQQHRLASRYDERFSTFHPLRPAGATLAAERRMIAREAARYRRVSKQGDPIGRIKVPQLGVNMILVNGTDHASLEKGPGRDLRTFMPGQGELIYIAGHRTTFLAPFADIESLRRGDSVTLELPYGTFVYRIVRHRIVKSNDLSVLQSHSREVVILQACHPRFFASHRYLAYATPVRVIPRVGRPYSLAGTVQRARPAAGT